MYVRLPAKREMATGDDGASRRYRCDSWQKRGAFMESANLVGAIHRWVMTSGWRRAVAAASCFWVAGVLVVALWSAIENGLEFYSRVMLGLLVVGVPVAFSCIVYAACLLGSTALKWGGGFIVVLAFAYGVFAYVQHKRDFDFQWRAQTEGLDSKQVEKLNGIRRAALHGVGRPWDEIAEEVQEERRDRLRAAGYSERVVEKVVPRPKSEEVVADPGWKHSQ